MHSHAKHTIHREHIHHGWNNRFPPRHHGSRPARPSQFETRDASSGQLSKTSTAETLKKLDLAFVNPVTGPVFIDGAKPGDALKVTVLSLQAVGLGLDGQHPGLRPAHRPVPRRAAASLELRSRPEARDVRAGRPGAAAPVPRHDRRGAGGARPAQHRPAAQCRRQHGRARHHRGRRALSADRGRRRAVLGRRHACRAGRRRGLRHGDREPDRRGAEVRPGKGRQSEDAALRHARPGDRPFRQEGLRGHDRHRPRPDDRRPHCRHGDDRPARASASAIRRSTPTCCAASAPTCASARSSTCPTGSSRSTSRGSCWSSRHATAASFAARLFISGWMRWPNCSMPIRKSSKVSMRPLVAGTVANSSSMRAT